MQTGLRALFLDRDGVINVDHGYVCSPERTDWVPGIFALCERARDLGYLLVVVTNQAGIARGYYSEQQFERYRAWVHGEFARRGVPLAATYHCPHHPTEGVGNLRQQCGCRKPRPGLLLRAQHDLGLDLGASMLIGDAETDIQAAVAAGVGGYLQVRGVPHGTRTDLPSLAEAIAWLDSDTPRQGN